MLILARIERRVVHSRNGVLFFVLIAAAGCATTPVAVPEHGKTGKGGYYQDDGPDENPPSNLQTVPNAVPKDEPLHRFANRPYEVLGNRYTPDVSVKPYKQQGIASWYGRKFKGKKTASGEPYDMYGMTAAHRTLPIPSYVRVTNLKNNQSVIVRINDRGPFHSNRLIDLSYTAASRLNLIGVGSSMVEVERVFADDSPSTRVAQSSPPATNSRAGETQDPDATSAAGLFVQLGAFGTLGTAENFRDKLRQDLTWLSETIQIIARDGLYRVRLGPYATRTEATAIADKIRETLDFIPRIATQ
jgi:rare lipoprotein A